MADSTQKDHYSSKPFFHAAKETYRLQLLSRDQIQGEYGLSKRWLELAALSGISPPMVRIRARMVRYQRGALENWFAARTVKSTSEEVQE